MAEQVFVEITDNPFEVSPDAPQSNAFEAEPEFTKRNQNKQNDVDAATVRAGASENPDAILQSGLGISPDEFDSQMVSEALRRSKKNIKSDLVRQILETPEEASQALIAAQERTTEIADKFDSTQALAKSLAYVETLNPPADMTDDEKAEIAVNHYMRSRVNEITDQSVLSTLVDMAGILAVPTLNYNISELSGKIGLPAEGANAYINSADFIMRVSRSINELPPEERIKAFEMIAQEMQDVDDNKIEQAIILMGIAGQASPDDIRMATVGDKLDTAGLGIFLGGRIVSSLRWANNIRTSVNAGNIDAAATMADRASRSDKVAAQVGVPREDAASAANPMIKGEANTILNGAPTEVASAVRDKFQRIDIMSEEALNLTPSGLGLTDVEKAAAA
jgi:hypothetical protein